MKFPFVSLLSALFLAGTLGLSGSLAEDPDIPGTLPAVLAPIPDQVVTSDGVTIDLANFIGLPAVTGQVYQITTTLGTFNIEMLANDAPITVANFENYVANQIWDNALIHRSMPGFVIQTGGFSATLPPESLTNFGTITNEFGVSNTRATIAMAKQGGNPNSASNQWFVNLADNSGGSPQLDTQNGGFTVFAHVLGTGMDVPDAIAAVPVFDAGSPYDNLPLRNMQEGQSNVRLQNFIAIEQIRSATVLPGPTPGPSVIALRVINPRPGLARATIVNGSELQFSTVRGETVVTIRGTDTNGNSVEADVTVMPPTTDASVAVEEDFDVSNFGLGAPILRIVGLPPGLVFDSETQKIVGFARRGGIFRPRALIELLDGSRRWEFLQLNVDPIEDWMSGNFDLLMDRSDDVGSGLGGNLMLRIAVNGLASGRLSMAGMNLPFRGQQVQQTTESEATLTVDIPARGLLTEDLTLQVTLASDGGASATVTGDSGAAPLAGWKRVWHPRTAPLNEDLIGQINVLLDLEADSFPEGDPDVPQGTGWAFIRTNRGGRANVVARLADGTRVTSAQTLGPAGELALWKALYRNGGSVILEGMLTGFGEFSGTGSWNRPAAPNPAARLYPAGFGNEVDGPLPLELIGSKWNRPAPGEVVLDLPFDPENSAANAALLLQEGGIDGTITPVAFTELEISQRNVATVLFPEANDARVVFRINRNTGLVTVHALLQDENLSRPGTTLRRPLVQQVLLVPGLGDDIQGGGFFLLRQMPDPFGDPPTTNATSPILSGKATLFDPAPDVS